MTSQSAVLIIFADHNGVERYRDDLLLASRRSPTLRLAGLAFNCGNHPS
jgi:hypothetical protein